MKLILIDCYGYFYKAHFAFQNHPLTNSRGEDTSVIFSFYNFLQRVILERKPDRVLCILDSKGPTHRHESYSEYKAHRPPMPDSLREQIEVIKTTLPMVGLEPIARVGFEADDIIAHYALKSIREREDVEVEIISSDKDLFQLVNERVRIVNTDQKNKEYLEYNITGVKEKFGVKPEHIIDYLALVGDSSDNVPGVKGVGKVTATKLIEQYGSLEKIYEKIDEVKGKNQEKLISDRDNAILSKELVTLSYPLEGLAEDLPDLEATEWKPVEVSKIKSSWEHYECLTLINKYNLENATSKINLKDLLGGSSEATALVVEDRNLLEKFNRKVVYPNSKEWDRVIDEVKTASGMVFDLETTSLDPYAAQIVSLVIIPLDQKRAELGSDDKTNSFYLPIIYRDESGQLIDQEKEFLERFKPILEDAGIAKVGHNLKYEYTVLKTKQVPLQGIAFDTMVYEYMLDPDRNQFKLENLVESYFGVAKPTYQDLSKGNPILELSFEELANYTFEDGEYTYLIHHYQSGGKKKTLSEQGEELFKNLEMKMVEVLAEMELSGVWIDVPFLKKLKKKAQEELKKNQQEIYKLSGEEFNINSTKQLQNILFEKLKIPPVKKTKTGLSTDNYVLTKLAKHHLIAQCLLSYRKYSKLLNTYILTLPTLINPKTGRIHTNYNQSVAATGRLSSNNPNLQNIPIGEESMGIRKAFIAPPDHQMVSIDYSQVELRILAYLSKDERLLQAYQEDQDIHSLTAHLIFNKSIDEVTTDERNIAKTINFSVIYGISSFSLGEDLNIPRAEAQFFIDSYFANYPKVKEYQNKILNEAYQNEYVETYFGRRRLVRDINAKNFSVKSRSERIAFNTVIQGTASDIIKLSMVKLHDLIKKGELEGKMIMQVHDELVFYIPDGKVDQMVPKIEYELCTVPPFEQILKVNGAVSPAWDK